jgi:hypothetical protein
VTAASTPTLGPISCTVVSCGIHYACKLNEYDQVTVTNPDGLMIACAQWYPRLLAHSAPVVTSAGECLGIDGIALILDHAGSSWLKRRR